MTSIRDCEHLFGCATIVCVMFNAHDLESLRRSHAMAPLSPATVAQLLNTCQQLTRERAQIAAVLADLPDSVAALRQALNRLHRLIS